MVKLLARKNWPCIAIAVTLIAMLIQLRAQGRIWFCECGSLRFWISEPDSPHTSQHLFDPYSFTHMLHGFIFYWVLRGTFKRMSAPWQLWLGIAIEALWEIVENTHWVIDRYREATAALGYTGDSVLNSFGDVLSCWLGMVIARRIGLRATIAVFIAVEVVLLITIRDNLTLNVLMLLFPLEAIKQWQMG